MKHFWKAPLACWLAWIFCASLLSPGVLLARDSIPVKTFTNNSFSPPSPKLLKRIDIIDAEECFAALQPIAIPFDIIKEGLDALQEQLLAPERNLACVTVALKQWNEFSTPEVDLRKAESAPVYATLKAFDSTNQLKLTSDLSCFNAETDAAAHDAYDKAHQANCQGKWLSPEAGAALKEKLVKEKTKNEVLMAQQMMEGSYIGHYLQGLWMQSALAPLKLSNGKLYGEVAPCFASEGLAETGKKQILAENPTCGGKLYEGEEAAKLEKEYMEAAQPLFIKGNLISTYLQELQRANPNATVFTMARNAKCFSPYPPGSSEARVHHELSAYACGSFGIRGADELPAFREKLQVQLDKLMPDLDRWSVKRAAKNEALGREYDRLNPDRYANYGTRRLLARFQNFMSQGGKPGALRAFCADYEKDQRRDLEFAKQNLDLSPFLSDRAWTDAARFGFTEAEYSAILSYTGAFYQEVNKALWAANGEALSPRLAKYQEVMLAGMEKIPPHKGAVRRFSVLPPKVLAAHEVGKVVTYDAYTSTSYDPKWNWSGGPQGTYHSFVIYAGKKGHRVDSISASEQEKEVLFTPGVRFKILSRQERAGKTGVYDFVMAEVDDAGNVIADLAGAGGEP